MDLTYKQRLFVEAYLGEANGNASEAARMAGYGAPGQAGSVLLKKREIQAAIARRVSIAAMPANEVLARYSEIASGSWRYFLEVDDYGGWKIDLTKAKKAGKLDLLKRIKETKDGLDIEIHDRMEALDRLAKYHGLFIEKVEHSTGGDLRSIAEYLGPELNDSPEGEGENNADQ